MTTTATKVLTDRINRIEVSATMAITAEALKMQAAGIDLANFGAGEPHFATPEHIKRAAIEAIEQNFSKYTAVAGVPQVRMDPVPAIVFHGDRDTTVDAGNGTAVVEQCVGATRAAGDGRADATRTTVDRGVAPGGRSYTRTIFRDATGAVLAEQWLVHGAGHAWFGGDASGSYTDPAGPDASEQMLRFFSACARRAIT